MSAALEFTPAACSLIPQGFPEEFRRWPKLRAVDDPPFETEPCSVPRAIPSLPAGVSVLHAPREAEDAAPIRLTRRGFVVLSVLVSAIAGGTLWLAAASGPDVSTAATAAGRVSRVVTVEPGDTLWAIAGRVAPRRDPRAEVDALLARNHLTDPRLTPGQTLRVP